MYLLVAVGAVKHTNRDHRDPTMHEISRRLAILFQTFLLTGLQLYTIYFHISMSLLKLPSQPKKLFSFIFASININLQSTADFPCLPNKS